MSTSLYDYYVLQASGSLIGDKKYIYENRIFFFGQFYSISTIRSSVWIRMDIFKQQQ